MIFLPGTQLPDAAATAERIRHLVETSVLPYAGHITVSAGVAALNDVQGSTEGLFRQADMALYEAKGAGRNIVIISTAEGMIINASDSQ